MWVYLFAQMRFKCSFLQLPKHWTYSFSIPSIFIFTAAKWWFPWCLLLLSCMTAQVWRGPAEEHMVKLLNKNFCWTYAPYAAACAFLGWRGSSWGYFCLSFLICIPLIMAAWNCSVISSVVSVNSEIIPGQAWSEIHKSRPLKGRVATLKKNKGPEVETGHGLETLDTLESWVFPSENLFKIVLKLNCVPVKLRSQFFVMPYLNEHPFLFSCFTVFTSLAVRLHFHFILFHSLYER